MKRKLLMIMALAGMLAAFPSGSALAAAPVQQAQVRTGDEIQPRYTNTINISSSLKIEGSTAYAFSTVTAKKSCHITVEMKLQRYAGSNWGWATVKTWNASLDGITKMMEKSYALSTRGTYRVSTNFNVGGEPLNYTSTSKTY